jgi:hypothetical protein
MERKHLICIIFLFILISIVNVQAVPFPERPFNPWGTIKINGVSAPNGTIVKAYVGGTLCGATVTWNEWYSVNVIGNNTLLNCGIENADVVIKIKNPLGTVEYAASQTLKWSAGSIPNVNLSVSVQCLSNSDCADGPCDQVIYRNCSGDFEGRDKYQDDYVCNIYNYQCVDSGSNLICGSEMYDCKNLNSWNCTSNHYYNSYYYSCYTYYNGCHLSYGTSGCVKGQCGAECKFYTDCSSGYYCEQTDCSCRIITTTTPTTTLATTTVTPTTTTTPITTTVYSDHTPPQYSLLMEPPNPSIYNPSATYTFKVDWTDNVAVADVFMEMDGTTYSKNAGQISQSGITYSITFSSCAGAAVGGDNVGGSGSHFYMDSIDPITPILDIIRFLTGGVAQAQSDPCLGIGAHTYRWYAKDTSNNWAYTNYLTFKIQRTDPVSIYIDSPENRTYSSNTVDVKYVLDSPFEISWVGYNLDNQPNVTLTGNTTINVAEGTHKIIFYATTVYDVTNSSDRIYFTVLLPKPDLIIEDIWTSESTINYRIKNQGNAISSASYSNLYVDDSYKTNDYVSSIAVGSSSNEYFSYSWVCSGTSDTIKVCADGNSNVVESNENNNCLTKTFTCPVTTTTVPKPCTCTAWKPTFTCCSGKEKYTRTCTPKGCLAESKCEGACFV